MSFDTRLKPSFQNFDRYGRRKRISKPYIVGYFSVNQNRQFIPDQSNLKYLKLPPNGQPIHFDLNEGYEAVQRKPAHAEDEKLNHILQFVLLNVKELATRNIDPECTDKFLNIDVICFRGKLRMLMCTPYESREGWSLLATKWKGNVYLCGNETERDKLKKQSESDEARKIFSYGFKFEQFVMSDSPTTEPTTHQSVLEGEEFCCMFTTKLENTSILYGAEMDGIESSSVVDLSVTDPNNLKFTELKVCISASNHRQMNSFQRFKTRNWWCQSHLANVEKIVVGRRTEKGIVDSLETINVESMPRKFEVMQCGIDRRATLTIFHGFKDQILESVGFSFYSESKSSLPLLPFQKFWSDVVCMEFLDNFLSMVKHMLKGIDCPHTVYRFDYDPNTNSSIQCVVLKGPNESSFIPDWYINEVHKFNTQ